MGVDLQYIYYGLGVISIIFTIVTSQRHTEKQNALTMAKFEKRMVRIETFLMLCCKKLDIPTYDINDL